MLPLLAAVFLAATACNTRNDSNQTDYTDQTGNTGYGADTTDNNYGSANQRDEYDSHDAQSSSETMGTASASDQNSSRQNEMSRNAENNQNNSADLASTDRNFAMKAYTGGQMEVNISKTALDKAQNNRVKNFAQMVVRDHTKANNQLENILSRKNIMTEVERNYNEEKQDNKDHMQNLGNKSGNEFDIAYMRMMVDDHDKTIDLFKKESNSGRDNDLKDFAQKVLPDLRMHFDSAKAIYGSLSSSTSTRY